MKPLTAFLVTALGVLVAVGIVIRIFGVGDSEGGGTAPIVTPLPTPHPDAITISMASSITKWEWLDAAVEDFNAASRSTPNLQVQGKPIHVEVLLVEESPDGEIETLEFPKPGRRYRAGRDRADYPLARGHYLDFEAEQGVAGPLRERDIQWSMDASVEHPGGHRHVGVPGQGAGLLAATRTRLHLEKHSGPGR